MITLSNGYEFEYMAASGALSFDGDGWPHEKYLLSPISRLAGYINPKWEFFNPSLFAVVIKTLTRDKRKGNFHLYWPWGCIRPIFLNGRFVGIVNAVGLTNPGIDSFWQEIAPAIDYGNRAVIASIFSDDMDMAELLEMAHKLNMFEFVALEINVSCPNTKKGIFVRSKKIIEVCESLKNMSRFPLILKLSVVHRTQMNEILPEIQGIIEAISINSIPWKIAFPDIKSPLEQFGGGAVSGKIAQSHTWAFIRQLVKSTDIPVIGCSVWDCLDMVVLKEMGAKAISFGSIFLRYPWCPWRPTRFVKKDMARRGL